MHRSQREVPPPDHGVRGDRAGRNTPQPARIRRRTGRPPRRPLRLGDAAVSHLRIIAAPVPDAGDELRITAFVTGAPNVRAVLARLGEPADGANTAISRGSRRTKKKRSPTGMSPSRTEWGCTMRFSFDRKGPQRVLGSCVSANRVNVSDSVRSRCPWFLSKSAGVRRSRLAVQAAAVTDLGNRLTGGRNRSRCG